MGKDAYKEIIELHLTDEKLSKATNAVSHYSFWSKEALKSELSCFEKMKYWLEYEPSMWLNLSGALGGVEGMDEFLFVE